MKALTSSCSKAIVDRPGSYFPRGVAHVSDTLQVCFSRNDNKTCNFWFLKLVQSRGIYPVQAVQSKTQQGELDTVESHAQQTNEPKTVHIKFQLQRSCNFGEQFLILGDDPMFGSWDPSKALPMTWSDGHIWTVELDIPAGKSIQFKFILKGNEVDITWQPGSDRFIHTWEAMNEITVFEDWENAELQKIIEEDQVAHSYEEPQIGSKMSTFADNFGHSSLEDNQTNAKEKPLADSNSSSMKKPMAIVAENTGSSEDLIKSRSPGKTNKNTNHQNEESADRPRNDTKKHDIRHNEKAAQVKNTFVKENLFEFEGGPVLVPGLTSSSVAPTEEAGAGKVEERITMDTSIGAFETKDQNMP